MTKLGPSPASDVRSQTAYLAKTGNDPSLALYRYQSAQRFRDGHALPPPWEKVELLGYTLPANDDRVRLQEFADGQGHFVTLQEKEPILPDYAYVRDLGFVYERFGPDLVRLLKLRQGKIEVAFDQVSGGSIWHLTHDGVQLINNCYYGRQGCVAIDLWMPDQTDRYCACDCGLTAAVKRWIDDPGCRMGAPCPIFIRDGLSARIRTIPIESGPVVNRRLGGSAFHPVVYEDFAIEKRATLGIRGHDGVLQFKVCCLVPRAGVSGVQRSRINILGLHLVSFMQHLVFYDPAADSSSAEADWSAGSGNRSMRRKYANEGSATALKDFTCVVLHDDNGHAVGMMGAGPGRGPNGSGSIDHFLGYNWREFTSGVSTGPEFSNRTVMMTAMNEAPLREGANDYCLYVLVGTLPDVKKFARDLYAHRQSLEW
jgi:hypothetical protein